MRHHRSEREAISATERSQPVTLAPVTYRRRVQGVSAVLEPDVRVQDPAALAEIELFGEVVVAAAGRDEHMSQDEIDRALGLFDSQHSDR